MSLHDQPYPSAPNLAKFSGEWLQRGSQYLTKGVAIIF